MNVSTPRHSDYLQTKYFPALDGLRALSILSVIWYHVPELRPLWRTGYLGVHLFFVISGFLITTLLVREKARTGKISLKNFYIRRTLRIFPAYYLTLGLYLVACYVIPDIREKGLENYLHNLPSFLTYTSNWFVDPWAPGMVVFVPAWSLATEEQFYLFWPSIVSLFRSVKVPVLIMCALIVGSQAIKVAYGYQFFLAGHSLPVTVLNSVSTAICAGCLLALLFDNRRGYEAASKLLSKAWSAPLFFSVMLFFCLVPNDDTLHVGRMLVIVASMVLLLGSLTITRSTVISPLLTNRVMRYIGMISYGLYLYHSFGLNIAERLLGWAKPYPALYFAVIVAVNIVLASLSYYIFERRFLELKEKLTRRRPVVTEEPALQPVS